MASVKFIGTIRSSLKNLSDCPRQESEGAPQAVVCINDELLAAVDGLTVGSSMLLFTWLHEANRETLTTRPRNNPNAPLTGVFATRSPDRPNPIGLHVVEILEINKGEIRVSNLEVLDGTPVIDIKPVWN